MSFSYRPNYDTERARKAATQTRTNSARTTTTRRGATETTTIRKRATATTS